MSKEPLVAIGIPAYNRPEGLKNTLYTLCNQSYANIEIHVSDDCSPDPMVYEVIQEFCEKDDRIKGYKQSKNLGIIGNHRFLLSKIPTDIPYLMWACDDDNWHSDYIKLCVEALEKHPEAILCATENLWANVDWQIHHDELVETLGITEPSIRFKKVLSNILWWNHSFYGLIRRSAYEKLPFQNVFSFDILFIAQLSLLGQFIKIPQPYFIKTVGGYGSELKRNLSSIKDERNLSRYLPRLSFYLSLRKTIKESSQLNHSEKRQLLLFSAKLLALKSAFGKSLIDMIVYWFHRGINAIKFVAIWSKIKHFRSAWLIHIHRLPAKDFSFKKSEGKIFSKKLNSVFETPEILFSNYHRLVELTEKHKATFEYDTTSGKHLMTIGNMTFNLKEGYYGFLLHEIFEQEVYRYNFKSPSIVIDIGTNVGVAALYFADQPNVKKVFGFEPFKETFDAAHDNLRLNPGLSTKVHVENFALSDQERTSDINYSFKTSTLSSIKENNPAASDTELLQPTTIQVKSTSDILAPLLEDYRDERKVLKIDTEGSEYEIVQDLHKSGLIKTFEYIMMEWHGREHHVLLETLKANNFDTVVTDQSYSDKSGHTGMIYAENKLVHSTP